MGPTWSPFCFPLPKTGIFVSEGNPAPSSASTTSCSFSGLINALIIFMALPPVISACCSRFSVFSLPASDSSFLHCFSEPRRRRFLYARQELLERGLDGRYLFHLQGHDPLLHEPRR